MRGLALLLPFCLLGCTPPASAPRAVVEIYMHPNGLSNCVDEHDGKWKPDLSCCPTGFEFVGFSAPAATAYEASNEKVSRKVYRHIVCLEIPQIPGPPK